MVLMHPEKNIAPEKVIFTDEQIRSKAFRISQKYPERSPDENWAAAIQALEKERPFRHWIAFWKWTGIGEKKGWDILQLLISASIPLLIFFGTQYFTSQNNKQQRETANKNNEQQRQIAKDSSKQTTLVKYLEEMAALLDDGLLDIQNISDKKFIIAQSKTVIALQSLDPKRQHLVIQFLNAAKLNTLAGKDKGLLYEARMSKANLIKAEISSAKLIKSDLRDANLRDANLFRVNFSRGKLGNADLRDSSLSGAKLGNADLRLAKLSRAQLNNADLHLSELGNADLSGANLSGADLSDANLSNASLYKVNLSGADFSNTITLSTDLSRTKNLTPYQLEGKEHPLICKTPLPKNIKIDLNRDCDKIPTILDEYNRFLSLDKAEKFVQEQRQKKWD